MEVKFDIRTLCPSARTFGVIVDEQEVPIQINGQKTGRLEIITGKEEDIMDTIDAVVGVKPNLRNVRVVVNSRVTAVATVVYVGIKP